MNEENIVIELNNIKEDNSIPFEVKKIRINVLETSLKVMKKHGQLELLINKFLERYQDIEYDENDFYIASNNIQDIRIFIKGKLLESDICEELRKNNIDTFTAEQLSKYIILYEEQRQKDLEKIKVGVELYSQLENIYILIAEEKNIIYSDLINGILNININSEQDINEYFSNRSQEILSLVQRKYTEHILNEITYNCFMNILNIFYSLLDYN